MPTESLHIERRIAAPAPRVWALARDFGAAWHPMVARSDCRPDAQGRWVRSLWARGEATPVRERLRAWSDSDRWLAYTLVDGLPEVEAYEAQLSVENDGAQACRVHWGASLRAPAARLPGLLAGTQAVFEAGLDALATDAGGAGARLASCATGGADDPLPEPAPIDIARPIPGEPRLAVSIAGTAAAGGGPRRLCLFLHGIGGGRSNWQAELGLAGRVMSAAALDLRGYGGSALGPRPSQVDDHVADILRVMRACGAERLVLVGLSFGAWLAASFAMRHPALLGGLVLSGGCTGLSEIEPAAREAFRRTRTAALDAGQPMAALADGVLPTLLGPQAGAAVRHALHASMAAIPPATYRDAVGCFSAPTERLDFSRLACPVMLVTGEHDRLAPPAEIRSVAARIREGAPGAEVRFEQIADAGHVSNLEQPAAYGRVLLAFLRRYA